MTQKIQRRNLTTSIDAIESQLELKASLALQWSAFLTFVKAVRRFSNTLLSRLCLALGLLTAAWAGVGGSISGMVSDPSGAAIAQAPISLLDAATGVRRSAITDGHGSYAFPVLPVGNYV